MNHRLVISWFGLGLVLGGRLALAPAADAPTTRAAAVELPPMMVEESVSSAPWLHINVPGAEFLSRCSDSTTRQFVEAWLASMQLVRALAPEEFLVRTDVPTVIVLYAQNLQQTMSAEIQRELTGGEASRRDRVNIAPNMRLADRDMHASIIYIDEAQFQAAGLSISPSHVRYLLKGRVPELPQWLIDGLERVWRGADFIMDPITLHPLGMGHSGDGDALSSDPSRPRALLPANELFAGDAARAAESRHPRHAAVRAVTEELFVRWAITSSATTRTALWKLVARAAESPVTEAMFEECFGFGFSELRDRLSDYLPKAVTEEKWISPGAVPPVPDFEVKRATPNQIARVRGEWERLAIGHVQRRLPQVREPYIAQARRTLRRAFTAGDRDPRLLATMGLCEIDADNPAGAREFLEPAVAGGVVRPRACYELARLRFAELQRDTPATKPLSFTDLAPVFQPLQRAMAQSPALPEVFVLLADAWARCETSPQERELAELATGARLFARRPSVAVPLARAFAQHGKKSEAAAVLDICEDNAAEDDTRADITRLRAELSLGVKPMPANPTPAVRR